MFYVVLRARQGGDGVYSIILGTGGGGGGVWEGGWFCGMFKSKGFGFVMAAFFLVWFGLEAGDEIGLWLLVATRAIILPLPPILWGVGGEERV